jgi:lantibiotic modifying enzyme
MTSWIIIPLLAALSVSAGKRDYFEAAQQTASWLQSCALQTQAGKTWPADPRDSTTVSTNLYSGPSGIVLFFLEMYRATKNEVYLNEARAGADYLIATLPDTISQEQSGLYTGVAGIGFVLNETFKITSDKKYRDEALRCVKLLHKHAKKAGAGIEWNNVTDIIGGSAGTARWFYRLWQVTQDSSCVVWVKKSARSVMQAAFRKNRRQDSGTT